jgi:dihydroxyacetone kinase-like protein
MTDALARTELVVRTIARTAVDNERYSGELDEAVVTDLPYTSGDRVALMVNGLGGTPISELYLVYRRAHRQLADRGIAVARSYVNEYCTSLDMAGASITLVRLDDEIEQLLAAPAEGAVRVF